MIQKYLIVLLVFYSFRITGQSLETNNAFSLKDGPQDTLQIKELILKAESFYKESLYDSTITYSRFTYSYSDRLSYLQGKSNSLELIGKSFHKKGEYEQALTYFLRLSTLFSNINESESLAETYENIASVYRDENNYNQSIKYLEKSLKLHHREKDDRKNINLLRNIAFDYIRINDFKQASFYYHQILDLNKKKDNKIGQINALSSLSTLAKLEGDLEKSVEINLLLIDLHQESKNYIDLTTTYNNLGFLYKRLKNNRKSLENFQKSIDIVEQNKSAIPSKESAVIFNNVGVAYTNQQLYAKAKTYYQKALGIREEEENQIGIADCYNYLSANFYVSGNNAQALSNVLKAIKIGEENHAKPVLLTSYKLLSLIYLREGQNIKAEDYESKYQTLKEQTESEENQKRKESLQKQLEAENREEKIKELIAENERNEFQLKQLALQAERRERDLSLKAKELALLKRNQEIQDFEFKNQQLEKERVQQLLLLTEQKLNADQQNQKISLLQKNKELQESEKLKKAKEIELLEKEKELQKVQLEEAAKIKQYGLGIIGLIIIILFLVIIGFILSQRSKRKLKKTQIEIQQKNEALISREEELKQNMETLQHTQDLLAEQKKILELENLKTTESIQYAKRIQSAILPSESEKKEILPESFLIYKPKDIVSGDFYWISEFGKKKIISVVDCTGHGVPGSLMSMVGSNIINEAINLNSITSPGSILNYLNRELKKKLKQEGGRLNDGMDLGLCTVEEINTEDIKLTYSGAKHTLFAVSNNEIIQLKSDRKSIGGGDEENLWDFQNYEVSLKKGDMVYLTTDGFIDQANEERRRFGSRKLKNLIDEYNSMDVNEQKTAFEEALISHKKSADQRDDITFLGFRV